MQFVTSGYVVTGDAINLTGAALIRVGDGTPDGATTIGTIASVLTGTDGLEKSVYGTLVLTGANTYYRWNHHLRRHAPDRQRRDHGLHPR